MSIGDGICGRAGLQQVERPVLVHDLWMEAVPVIACSAWPGLAGFSPDAKERVPEIDWGIIEERMTGRRTSGSAFGGG